MQWAGKVSKHGEEIEGMERNGERNYPFISSLKRNAGQGREVRHAMSEIHRVRQHG